MLPKTESIFAEIGLLLGICLMAGVAAYGGKIPRIQNSYGWPDPSGNYYRPSQSGVPGAQLLFVFIGSSTCKYSSAPELPGVVEDLKLKIAAEAKRRGAGYKVVGVGIDNDFRQGVHYLKRFGYFDEVTAGNGHFNSAFIKYVYDEIPGEGATPQILVIQRNITVKDGDVSVGSERLLRRVRGRAAIIQWAQRGAVLPSS